MSGMMNMLLGMTASGFAPFSVLTAGSGSTTVPLGVTSVMMQAWGPGGGGGGGVSGIGNQGGGGGTGGYSRFTKVTGFTPGVSTISYTVGTPGNGGAVGVAGTTGTATTASGSWFNTVTCGSGLFGTDGSGGSGTPGNGGAATNTNAGAVNTAGNVGSNTSTPAAGVTGVFPPDAGPYGTGGLSGGFAVPSPGGNGGQGGFIVYYT